MLMCSTGSQLGGSGWDTGYKYCSLGDVADGIRNWDKSETGNEALKAEANMTWDGEAARVILFGLGPLIVAGAAGGTYRL